MEKGPDIMTLISCGIAAAILLPIGAWLKANYAEDLGYLVLSLGGLLY